MKRVLALLWFSVFVLSLGAWSGCAHQLSTAKLESRSIVVHYDDMRQQLNKKERSGSEGGCPTCVY